MTYQTTTPDPRLPSGGWATLIGFAIGLLMCIIISMCSSCSRKVTEHTEKSDSLSLTTLSLSNTSLEDSLSASTTRLRAIINEINDYWRTNTKRIYYSAPDSLGNQYVTHTEQTEAEHKKEDVTTVHDTIYINTNAVSRSNTQTLDNTNLQQSHHEEEDKTVTSIPWYYKYALQLVLAVLAFLLVFTAYQLMVRKYKKS